MPSEVCEQLVCLLPLWQILAVALGLFSYRWVNVKENVTLLLTHWSYVFLALILRLMYASSSSTKLHYVPSTLEFNTNVINAVLFCFGALKRKCRSMLNTSLLTTQEVMEFRHRNANCMLTEFTSLTTLEVIFTICGVANDQHFFNMVTFSFQYIGDSLISILIIQLDAIQLDPTNLKKRMWILDMLMRPPVKFLLALSRWFAV